MADGTCPDVCQQRLKTLEAHKDECVKDRRDTYKHWEAEVKKLTPQRTFFWLVGIAVLVLLATFGALYNQGNAIGDKLGVVHQRMTQIKDNVHDVEKEVVKAQAQIKALERQSGTDTSHRTSDPG